MITSFFNVFVSSFCLSSASVLRFNCLVKFLETFFWASHFASLFSFFSISVARLCCISESSLANQLQAERVDAYKACEVEGSLPLKTHSVCFPFKSSWQLRQTPKISTLQGHLFSYPLIAFELFFCKSLTRLVIDCTDGHISLTFDP